MSVEMCMDSSILRRGLSSLYTRQELTDVRIVCSDGQLMAHKTVLSAVSDNLRLMMTRDGTQPNGHSFIVFADLSIEDIKPIIDCIYFGHKSIETKRFSRFTQIADNFGIRLTTAVSNAFNISNKKTSDNCPIHSKSVNKLSNWKTSEDNKSVETDQKVVPNVEMPMDLSATTGPEDLKANVLKIIESIATNGSSDAPKEIQMAANRRRKQSEPKAVRFDQNLDVFGGDNNMPFDEMFAEEIDKAIPIFEDMVTEQLAPTPTPEANNSSNGETIVKTEVRTPFNSLVIKPKATRTPKSLTLSEDQLKDCCVCGKTHATHKQLINHLNKEHKTEDIFKCPKCGKEQKYAKSFAVHSIQCQTKNSLIPN